MNRICHRVASALSLSLLLFASSASADAEVGKEAPPFELKDTNGKSFSLKEFRGKVVVLEWLNFDCPFVKKHYSSGNLPKLQENETQQGTVWLSIVSSAPGKQGYFVAKEMKERQAREKGKQTAILYDSDGKVGKKYGAKTTPHLFVIGKDGKVAYRGAIDDRPSTDVEDVSVAKNYVKAAMDQIRAGKKVEVSDTQAYGCGVKYE